MASRCVGCQNRDAAIADLTKEVERLREALADAENCHRTSDQWKSHYQTKLARLVEGLEEIQHEARECGSFQWIHDEAERLIKAARKGNRHAEALGKLP